MKSRSQGSKQPAKQARVYIYKERKSTVIILLFIFLGIILFFLAVMWFDCHRFVIREYTIESGKLTKDGKFLLLSDLHNKSFGAHNEKLMKAIDAQRPDVILLAGDIYTAGKGLDNSEATAFVCKLAEKYPVYCGNGNHEQKTRLAPEYYGPFYEKYISKVKKSGAVVLVNEKVALPAFGMQIYGLEIERRFYQKFICPPMDKEYMQKTLGKSSGDAFNLLIAHNPDYFENYADWGADLVVSGHVHGGLMRLPILGGFISPRLRLFPYYDGGRFERGKSTMILSRGLGTHTLPIRIFNPGELIVLRMKRRETETF